MKEKFEKKLNEARKISKKNIESAKSNAKQCVDKAENVLIIMTDNSAVMIGNKIDTMAAISVAFSNWLEDGMFKKEELKELVDVAEMSNNNFRKNKEHDKESLNATLKD